MQTAIGRMATPIFFQFVTDVMFKQLIKCYFLLKVDEIQAEKHQALTYEESNALRYAAGYVPQALRKQLEKGSHPLKEELILCLADMCEGNDDDADVDHDSSSDWIKEINRGGLKLINNKSYHFFYSMEMVVRHHLTTTAASTISAGFKDLLIEAITSDEDVQFFWSILPAEWEEEELVLFQMIINLWITIRGFSFAGSWLEMHKQSNKKTVQKSKGIRKHLIGSSSKNV